ncbi:DUF2953 domain-containing protein [Bacillus sp. NPDC077027]|uniref:DUF2953 domain-containing protein n=1 Tax=Bacillus sp. NPDC077027 TaxID=3390548 RepID=UPI003D07E79C
MWIAVICILLSLFLIMKVTISFEYLHANDNDKIVLKMNTLYGLIRLKKVIPMVKVNTGDQTIDIRETEVTGTGQEEAQLEKETDRKKIGKTDIKNVFHQMERMTKEIVDLNQILRQFFIQMKVVSLHWSTIIGLHDAALTGVAAGGVWSVKGALMAFLQEHLTFKHKPMYEVIPAFQHTMSKTHFSCIAYFRIGHAMLAAIRLLVHWIKGRKARKNASIQATKNESSV